MTVAPLFGMARAKAATAIAENHYTRSIPAGKNHLFEIDGALVLFAIPANGNVSRFLIGEPNKVWELSRLWAPDGHPPNLLTKAIAKATQALRQIEPGVEALVSYADPNAGHKGGVYRAASWTELGHCEETRCYRDQSGQIVARRAFHSGSLALRKGEIEARGFSECRAKGKIRFARGLTRQARKRISCLAMEMVAP